MNKKLMAVIGLEFAYEKVIGSINRDTRELFDEAYNLAVDNDSDKRLAAVLRQIRSRMRELTSLKEPDNEHEEKPG